MNTRIANTVRGLSVIISTLILSIPFSGAVIPKAFAADQVLYAMPGKPASGLCDSWANACNLQYALTTAVSGQEIWVAAGTYSPTTGTDRTATFQLKAGVALYGGFVGTETAREQRDSATNVTTLSGDVNGDDIGFSNNIENVYHVTTGATGAILDGFTITGGNATLYRDSVYGRGGGMYNTGSPVLTNLIFTGNVSNYGGGMDTEAGNPTLTNITFSGNNAGGGFGGGLFMVWGGSPTLTNVTFSGNTAGSDGGAIATWYANSPTLTNVTISGNATVGSAIDNQNTLNMTIRNSIIWGDTNQEFRIAGSNTNISDSVVQGGCPTGSTTCTNIIAADPILGTPGNYGGFTPTIPLLAGSSAIDTANDAICPATDQRGVSRPQGLHCDIGAFEYVNKRPPTLHLPEAMIVEATGADGAAVTYTATATDDVDPNPTLACTPASGATFPLGATTVECTASNASGNIATGSFTVTVKDTTAPAVAAPPDVTATATSPSGAVVTYPPASAHDIVAGTLTPTCTPASGATFGLGLTTVTCTATDQSGNTSSATFKVTVTYAWSGVLQPVNADGSSIFKAGSTIPVKFALTGASAQVSTATATLSYAKVSNGIEGNVVEAATNVEATTGNLFRYSGGQYIFNWSTKGLTAGTYSLKVDLGDGVTHAVTISLK